ncbi:MAG: hypothetical protein EBQ99_03565 [Planctomycetes bacterium]|nr:hypothetical protein [Planctomycetota bacterium]
MSAPRSPESRGSHRIRRLSLAEAGLWCRVGHHPPERWGGRRRPVAPQQERLAYRTPHAPRPRQPRDR